MASIADTPFTSMGLDAHKDSISVGLLAPGVDDPPNDRTFHEEACHPQETTGTTPATDPCPPALPRHIPEPYPVFRQDPPRRPVTHT